jgi:cytochrome P450
MPPNPEQASLFADLNPQHHGTQRRKVASAYSMSSLISYEPFVDNCASLLISHFDAAAASGKTLDFGHWFRCYAFDVIGEITFGQRFGLLDDGIDKDGIFGAIDARSSYSTFVGLFPWLHQFLFPLQPTTGNHAYVAKYTKHHIALREKLYQSGEEKLSNGSQDFVSKFLDLRATDSGMTTTDIFTTCQSNIGAGSDTTAITISAVLYYLLKHPQTFKKLQSEIDTVLVEETMSVHISFKQANRLPYLQAVIKEALRLHSATGLPLARLVPPSGVNIGEFHFRGGATVGINSWVAHRNSSIFGKDVNDWRPERWLEFEQDGRGAEVEKYFLPFGMGSRTCIGKNLSLLEVSKLICELLRRFEFELDEQILQKNWTTTNVWFVKPENFLGKVIKRHSK